MWVIEGGRDDAVMRALTSHQCTWPKFDSVPVRYQHNYRYVGWVCCWFSPCSEGFSPGSLVSSFTKTNLTRLEELREKQLRKMRFPFLI